MPLLAGVICLVFLAARIPFSWRIIKNILCLLTVSVLSYSLCVLNDETFIPSWYGHHIKKGQFLLVELNDAPRIRSTSVRYPASVLAVIDSQNYIPVEGQMLIYLKKASFSEGDTLLIKNKAQRITNQGNPGEFNYSRYIQRKGIHYQQYVQEGEVKKINTGKGKVPFFHHWHRRILDRLKPWFREPSQRALAEALLTGYRNDLDESQWQAFSRAGIVHIIAISGMHLSMIYLSLRFLFLQIPLARRRKVLSVAPALILMFLFAGITGFPASVNRAATMFLFMGVGECLHRTMTPLNSLCASAFVLLSIDPQALYDPGFQLSYAAVLSLILFHNPIRKIIPLASVCPEWIRSMLSSTLAAQILTIPLCLYYFHQFPLWFLPANLLAIPLSTLILYGEIVWLCISSFPVLAHYGSLVLQSLLQFFLYTTHWIAARPSAVWEQIQCTLFQAFLLYLLIVFLFLTLKYKVAKGLLATLAVLIVLSITLIYREYSIRQQRGLVWLSSGKQSVLLFVHRSAWYSTDSLFQFPSAATRRYLIEPARLHFGIDNSKSCPVMHEEFPGATLYSFAGKTILRIFNTDFKTARPVPCDWLILSTHQLPASDWLRQHVQPSNLLIDARLNTQEKCKLHTSFHLPADHIHQGPGYFSLF